ncbi:hypothetical protein B0H14DRAFT_2349611 [Mycena olivaceomarginata]|nr:hypothetical protein B0H14DRAFT_2349611 [Mycena olivaceomarginata]
MNGARQPLTVPKTRLIGGHLGVYICLLGDDVLETLFGRCRMIGGHSPNCSVGELRDRCCSAMNLDAVYDKYPELERPPRRLKLIRTRDLDHVKPGRWEGEVRADSCDLKACWSRAVAGAEAIRRKHGVKMKTTFAQLFKQKDTDLMRPFGGKYPSISASVDQSAVDFSSADMPSDLNPNSTHNSLLHINFDEMIALEIAQAIANAEPHSHFAVINKEGHLIHKKFLIRILFDMTHNAHASHDPLTACTRIHHRGQAVVIPTSQRELVLLPNSSSAP